MSELTTLIEKLVDLSGQDFIVLTAGAEVTGLDLMTIVPNEATVFAKLTGKSGANLLTGKAVNSVSIGQGTLMPFYKDHVTNVQITSGSALGYSK